jgi:hypothetical protein
MAVQAGSKPSSDTTVPTDPVHRSNVPHGPQLCHHLAHSRRAELRGKRIASIAKNVLAAAGMALAIGSFGLVAGTGTAAADGLDATPMPPAVIDYDGTHNYDTSSYPADPTWPAPPSWGTYPGDSSHPCCSR